MAKIMTTPLLYRNMRFKQWLFMESSGQLLLAKAMLKQGFDSVKQDGFKLGDRHASVINTYNKHHETTTEQMYGPGLYFGIVPSEEFAKKNCKDYAEEWGEYMIIATLKQGAKGLVTSWNAKADKNNPLWAFSPAYDPQDRYTPDTYHQLKALGVSDMFPDYGPNNIHNRAEWGYKLYKKIDFWAHQHNSNGHVVVYNPSVLQIVSEFECEHKHPVHNQPQKVANQPTIDGTPYSIPNDKANASQTLKAQGDKAAPKVDPRTRFPQPEGQAPPGKKWNKLLGRWIDAPDAQKPAPSPIQRRSWPHDLELDLPSN